MRPTRQRLIWMCSLAGLAYHSYLSSIKTIRVNRSSVSAYVNQGDAPAIEIEITIANSTHNANNAHSNANKKSSQLPPRLIIGAGQGTTGTHTLHCASCLLGLTSVHWKRDCSFCDNKKTNTTTNTTQQYNYAFWPQGLRKVVKHHPHGDAKNRMHAVLRCLNARTRGKKAFQCPPDGTNDMVKWAADLKARIDKVTEWHKRIDDEVTNYKDVNFQFRSVDALHDTPYTVILPYLIESATTNRGGQPPIVLLSERDPLQWTNRRLEMMHQIHLCRLDLEIHHNNSNHISLSPIKGIMMVSNDPPLPSGTSHFDLFSCIDRTARAKREKLEARQLRQLPASNGTQKATLSQQQQTGGVILDLAEVFTTAWNLLHGKDPFPGDKVWLREDLMSHIVSSFESHQNFWREKADLHWNMWERNVTIESAASELQEVISSFRGTKKL